MKQDSPTGSTGLVRARAYVLLVGVSISLEACGSLAGPERAKPRNSTSSLSFSVAPNSAWQYGFFLGGEAKSATIEIIVDWSSSANDIDMTLNNRSGQVLGQSATKSKPERLVVSVEGRADYTLVVANRGPGAESGTAQMNFTYSY